mmetsp:Transcript_19797/g.43034  ORF Transcript_19797/g.43034 Transcript_19797/m.43034 type:complete len:85 (-) Transcript_19797:1428-1682(-)
MPIVCTAIIGQQNNPLYLRTFPSASPEQILKLNFIVHCALDAVEEKEAHRGGSGYLFGVVVSYRGVQNLRVLDKHQHQVHTGGG